MGKRALVPAGGSSPGEQGEKGMTITLSDIKDMTLLQIASLPTDELERLSRAAYRSLGQADNYVKRLHNARYLHHMSQINELAGGLALNKERDE